MLEIKNQKGYWELIEKEKGKKKKKTRGRIKVNCYRYSQLQIDTTKSEEQKKHFLKVRKLICLTK